MARNPARVDTVFPAVDSGGEWPEGLSDPPARMGLRLAGQYLQRSRTRLFALIRQGELDAEYVGNAYVVTRAALIRCRDYLASPELCKQGRPTRRERRLRRERVEARDAIGGFE
jgi:hypothetical protein